MMLLFTLEFFQFHLFVSMFSLFEFLELFICFLLDVHVLDSLQQLHGVKEAFSKLIAIVTLQTVHYLILVFWIKLVNIGLIIPKPILILLNPVNFLIISLLGLFLSSPGLDLRPNKFLIEFALELKNVSVGYWLPLGGRGVLLLLLEFHFFFHQVEKTASLGCQIETLLGLHLQILKMSCFEGRKCILV